MKRTTDEILENIEDRLGNSALSQIEENIQDISDSFSSVDRMIDALGHISTKKK